MKERFKDWNKWRKDNLNGKLHQLLVLFGIIKSPTFELNRAWKRSYILQQEENDV